MGFDLANVDEMSGAIFTGAGGAMPVIWVVVAALVCLYALWDGKKHEHEAYDKLKK